MPLFRKSRNKDDRTNNSNTAAGSNDPSFSGPGVDPNFMGYGQPGANNGPGPGYNPSQQPYHDQGGNTGGGYPDHHSKPSRLGGKVETAIGTMVGSDNLRTKGMEKEREARDLNMQSNELAQAESLEREAQMHRDRAMRGGGGGDNSMSSNADRRFNY